MFKKKPNDDSDSHVKNTKEIKYTKQGHPYFDVDKFFASDRGKKLDKRMEMVGEILRA